MPKLSLPVRLGLLIAGTTLPLIVFAAVIVFDNYEQDRADATQRVLETVLFYHPALWWLSRRLRLDREACCDEIAVAAA